MTMILKPVRSLFHLLFTFFLQKLRETLESQAAMRDTHKVENCPK